jgi:hypothetical protein
VDFEKAFDTVDRDIIWKLMHHYSIPFEFIRILQRLYEKSTCQDTHSGKLTSPCTVKTGVKQGCMLSPTIFLMLIDWIMRQTTIDNNNGMQWTFTKQLEDLDFDDDVDVLSSKQKHAQTKLNKLSEDAKKIGRKSHSTQFCKIRKTKVTMV